MQASHNYISKARSRSPSPAPSLNREGPDVNEKTSLLKTQPDDDGLLHVQGGINPVYVDDDQGITSASDNDDAKGLPNQFQPIEVQVTATEDSPSRQDRGVKELQDRTMSLRRGRDRRHSSGQLEDMTSTSAFKSYGSISGGSMASTAGHDNVFRDNNQHGQPELNPGIKVPSFHRNKCYYTPGMVDELRKRNRLYFLDPITKLTNFHGFPWKLTLQVIKIIMITAQIIIFGGQREIMVEYFSRSDLAFHHLLLMDWDASYETMPYQPATGQYAIYTLEDLYDHMNNVSQRYYELREHSLAAIHLHRDYNTGEIEPIQLCFQANKFVEFGNGSYIVSDSVLHNCTYMPMSGEKNQTYDIVKYLKDRNFYLPFNRTLDIHLKMHVETYHLNLLETHYGPACYNVSIEVKYKNTARSGQMLISLDTHWHEIDCHNNILSEGVKDDMDEMKAKYIAFDASIIACCILSTILCSRSLKRSNNLRRDTAKYFRLHRGKPFSFSNHVEYINGWYIIIIINDVFTSIGSAIKIQLDNRAFSIDSQNYALCSEFLGIGVFLTFVGILRYLGFFKSYNVLILTLKTSFPHVMRFLVCAIILFLGFLFCGWIVFSPYHIKFRTLATASECLFSLVNGDDMFVTFSALTTENAAIWYFQRAYLYVFISLFIYVVLSVFIAVIMDNYEHLKTYFEKGFVETEIQLFIRENGEITDSELFCHVRRDGSCASCFFCVFPCLGCLRKDPHVCKVSEDRRELLATI